MIIFVKYNSKRKFCFQLITKIEIINDVKFSVKRASNLESIDFLNSFYDKYSYLKQNNFSFKPLKPIKRSYSELIFDYLNYQSLENLLFSCLENNNKDEFVSLIKKYEILIKDNKVENQLLNSKFFKIFGKPIIQKKVECLNVGCLDLNFDNIFYKSKNQYLILDYEWTFIDVPIPYKYIMFRAISYFYFKYFNYDVDNFFSRNDCFNLLKISKSDLKQFIDFEYHFQKYVYGNTFEKNISKRDYCHVFFNYPKSINSPQSILSTNQELQNRNQELQSTNQELQNRNQEYSEQLNKILNLNYLNNKLIIEIKEIKKELFELESNLNKIKSAKFFKLWQTYNKIKKIF